MQRRKRSTRCCPRAPVYLEMMAPHCAFCQVQLCPEHTQDVEVEGHVFSACGSCAATLRSRRPGKHEHCTCHDEEYCDLHQEIEGIG